MRLKKERLQRQEIDQGMPGLGTGEEIHYKEVQANFLVDGNAL